jgi:hypothetical protein
VVADHHGDRHEEFIKRGLDRMGLRACRARVLYREEKSNGSDGQPGAGPLGWQASAPGSRV